MNSKRSGCWQVGTVILFGLLSPAAECGLQAQERLRDRDALPAVEAPPVLAAGRELCQALTSPFRMSRKESVRMLGFAAVTAGLYFLLDDRIDEEYAREGDNLFYPAHELAEIGAAYDQVSPVAFTAGFTAGLLAGGLVLQDQKLLQTTKLLVEASVLTQAITYLGKHALGRARPDTDQGPHHLTPFKNRGNAFQAMPSGHASSVFATMTVISKQYDRWWVRLPAYTFATAVAFQRMEDRRHWASDVLVGGGLGYWVASTVVRAHARQPQGASWRPAFGTHGLGLAVAF